MLFLFVLLFGGLILILLVLMRLDLILHFMTKDDESIDQPPTDDPVPPPEDKNAPKL